MSARLGYTFVPYGNLQQGRKAAPNPNELGIDVHLGTVQVIASAPTATTLDVQLPFGSLMTRSIAVNRTDSGIGDLELRVRQSITKYLTIPRVDWSATLGAVVATGPYVEKSGAANIAPEASFLTLGRGAQWLLAETDASAKISDAVSGIAQMSTRLPLGKTRDDFEWGNEARATLGARVRLSKRFSALAATDIQWRGGATEPDPFTVGSRLQSANVGGIQWSLTPSVTAQLPAGFSIVAGARIPLYLDVTGNQLVPQIGAFTALSYALPLPRSMTKPKSAPPVDPSQLRSPIASRAVLGKFTVVDYWATWCKPCTTISLALETAEPSWPDVVIVKVDASAWPDPAAPALPAGAKGLPVIEIFDAQGKQIALLVGDAALTVVDRVNAYRTSIKPPHSSASATGTTNTQP
jgi:thiol-disulfide isomerase/thioredoxin